MQILVTRFHLLILTVTTAITGVGFFRVPADYVYLAHWGASTADWLWPRDFALPVAPILQIVLLVVFFLLGRALTKNHYAKVQHILDPALTLVLLVIAACQLGLLLTGIGSDLDFVRVTAFGLGATLIVLGIVLFEAERHTYAGFRMPWPIRTDAAWRLVHRITGLTCGLIGIGLIAASWFDIGLGLLLIACAAALILPPIVAAITTIIRR